MDEKPTRQRHAEETETLTVEEFRDDAEWDGFVRSSAKGTFCHWAGWRNIFSDVLGHQCHYLVARARSGECKGVLPLVRVRSILFGDYLLSTPFLNYGGPLGTREAERLLCDRARQLAREFDVKLLELRTRHGACSDLRTTDRKVTVLLPLPASAAQLMAQFPAKLRSQIRRPLKEGMAVRFGTAQLDAFYHVFARNMRDLGTPVLPRRFFEAIAETFPAHVVIGVVYHGDAPVAAGCGFVHGREFELTWASSLREHGRQAPNMLLYWELMQHAIDREVGVFNFGRCTPGTGTHRFKVQWGGQTVHLPWLQWSTARVGSPPTPESPLFSIASRAWSRLPLAVANTIGPLLARNLP